MKEKLQVLKSLAGGVLAEAGAWTAIVLIFLLIAAAAKLAGVVEPNPTIKLDQERFRPSAAR